MNLDLNSVSNALSSYMPSGNALVQNIALGAATSVVLAGLKQQVGSGAMDPLNLFPHPAAAPAAPAAQSNNPSAVVGPTITASAFASLPPATQAQLSASGVHIVAG